MALNALQSLPSARRLPLQQLRVARPFHTRPPVVKQTSLVGPPRCTFRAAQSPISTAQRSFTTTQTAYHGTLQRPKEGTGIKVTFRDSKGSDIRTVEANEGDDLLSIAHEYDIDLEGESTLPPSRALDVFTIQATTTDCLCDLFALQVPVKGRSHALHVM